MVELSAPLQVWVQVEVVYWVSWEQPSAHPEILII